MEEQRDKFVKGAISNDYSEEFSIELFEDIAFFAGYGFNKSHAAAYALIAYQTAYLKHYYKEEFIAALGPHVDSIIESYEFGRGFGEVLAAKNKLKAKKRK